MQPQKLLRRRGKNLIVVARRQSNLEHLKSEILGGNPALDVVIKAVDLSLNENVHKLYQELAGYKIETWINNAGFGNYDSVAHQDLNKIETMLRLNVEALTIFSTLYVHDYQNIQGTQLINISSAGGYTIVPTAVTYCAAKFYVSTFTEGLARELREAHAELTGKSFGSCSHENENLEKWPMM